MPRKPKVVPSTTMHEMPPTVRIHGNQAKQLHGIKPGSKVTVTIIGKVMSSGIEEYDKTPFAVVQVNRVRKGK